MASRGAAARSVTVKPTGYGIGILTRGDRVSRFSAALSSATQHAMPPELAESGERSVLTLGSLCLPCCLRDTA